VIGSLYSIIITFELRSSISAQDIYAQSQKFSALYGHSSGSKALDNLQQYYMCCGGFGDYGYQIYSSLGLEVPESCCIRPSANCGWNILSSGDCDVRTRIYTRGCFNVINDVLENRLEPFLYVYGICGMIMVVFQVLSVAIGYICIKAIYR